ncbi:hypothetical protein KDW55_28990 [Burkholderia sp. AU19243]|uniref:hypothetical protein n=1 Tax=Burkholderia sp. AU19243 TaxID=2824810 RepID=UPI001B909E70|nr:hypothetical protein [Burkholderia sp. AU19243]MBR8142108.1 hypothetical protein [Burkholderia vietnamiensis]MBR8367358.1 hypothetical protein [Burkholderia sp. AU19243]
MLNALTQHHTKAESQASNDSMASIEAAIQQLHCDLDGAKVRCAAAKAAADALRANLDGADPTALQAALLEERDAITHLDATETKHKTIPDLERAMHEQLQRSATDLYLAAVRRYAAACACLPALSEEIKKTALAAGILLTPLNSPHLIGRSIHIGGAVVDIPPQTETV